MKAPRPSPMDRLKEARAELKQAELDLMRVLKKERTRKRAPIVRLLHETRRMMAPDYPYVSQAGQDHAVDRALRGLSGGTFVDVGGYDGVTGSNTLFFEMRRGWTGVLVEPVAGQLEKAKIARKCPCLPYAVAPQAGTAEFIEVTKGYTQMSGLADLYDETILSQIRNDPRHEERTVKVETRTLSQILDEADIANPDFISLDIEGGEAAVLDGFPFDKHAVKVWAIENNTAGPEIGNIMRKNGYDLAEFCGPDEIYIKL